MIQYRVTPERGLRRRVRARKTNLLKVSIDPRQCHLDPSRDELWVVTGDTCHPGQCADAYTVNGNDDLNPNHEADSLDCPSSASQSLQSTTRVHQAMDSSLLDLDVYVIQAPLESRARQKFASVFRELRLRSLYDEPEAFTEKFDAASARPMQYWFDFVEQHNGLIHIAFGLPKSKVSDLAGINVIARNDLIMEQGRALGMAVNTGPVHKDQFLSLPGSQIPQNRPDDQEQRFHAGMLFHVPEMRGPQRGLLFETLVLDRDEWLLNSLRSTAVDPPPLARFRGNIKPGRRQKDLLLFYTRAGWYIAGTQTWRSNVLAEGGPAAVKAAEIRGDNMDEVSIVVEKIFTVAQLEWQIEKNKAILKKARARL